MMRKFLNFYLPTFLSVTLVVMAGFFWLNIQEAEAAVAYISSSQGSCSTSCAGATMASAALSTTTGNLIVALVQGYLVPDADFTITGVTDTAGNTYVQGAGCENDDVLNVGVADIWYAKNATGHATNVVTATFSSSSTTYRYVAQLQYSGVDKTSPFEVCALGSDALAQNSITSGSFSPAISGNVNVAIGGHSGAASAFTAGTNYTKRVESLDSPTLVTEDRLAAPAGAQTAAYSFTGTAKPIHISVASFKAAASTATPKTNTFKAQEIFNQTNIQ